MKAIVDSINPRICEKVANGECSVILSKTKPKLQTPFKCYLYCTKDKKYLIAPFRFYEGWKVKKYDDTTSYARGCTANMRDTLNGKVIGEFICDLIIDGKNDVQNWVYISEHCGMSGQEIYEYCGEDENNDVKYCYGLHISDLKIYDKPKKLGEFKKPGWFRDCIKECRSAYAMEYYRCLEKDSHKVDPLCGWCRKPGKPLKAPPQTYYYVEEQK